MINIVSRLAWKVTDDGVMSHGVLRDAPVKEGVYLKKEKKPSREKASSFVVTYWSGAFQVALKPVYYSNTTAMSFSSQ